MEPISWSVIAGLILQYGIPLAERIYQKAAAGTPPTQADFDELNQMKRETPLNLYNQMLAARMADPDSDWAKQLRALIEAGASPTAPPLPTLPSPENSVAPPPDRV